MFEVPDAPWIGLCKEEWEERCRLYEEDEEEIEEEDDEE